MLRACWRVLRPGGRLACTVIHARAGLTPAERERVRAAGPAEVESRLSPREALVRAGFARVVEEDLTAEYLTVTRRAIAARERFEVELRLEEGDERFAEELATRERTAAAVEAGLLRRTLLVGQRPNGLTWDSP